MSAEEKRNAGQDGEMPFLSKNEGVSSSSSLLGLGQTPIPQTSFHYVSDLGVSQSKLSALYRSGF
jgi:hypothetical protein